ncbi:MAG: hypothetical protein LUG19_00455 [Desulfovibrio sp.]|uniref:hypothetical protein n=1 Tax=Desulfovibrio sp. TaxID=885 RepID=UPI00258D97BB|nr:hypothetical protein [Desulfovibrio sp.]MCD7982709.1 hypothetical protein [Desulfovibrio sp.]
MDIASLIGGLGIGSVLTLFLKEYFDNKKTLSKRVFEEKREAYIAYLDVLMKSQLMPEKEATWAKMAAMARVRLSVSPEAVERFNVFLASHPSSYEKTFDELIQAMRKDLWG